MNAKILIQTSKIRVDKISAENDIIFLSRLGQCIANARTSQARWRLYQTALTRVNYTWMLYVDKITA